MQFRGLERVGNVQRAGVEPAILIIRAGLQRRGGHRRRRGGQVAGARVPVAVQVGPNIERFRVERALPGPPDLLIDEVGGPGHVQRGANHNRRPVQVARARFRNVAAAVHLLVLASVLVVVVRLERELGPAHGALEAATVEEGEILEGPNPIHLVHCLITPQTGAFVEIHAVHCYSDGKKLVSRHREARQLGCLNAALFKHTAGGDSRRPRCPQRRPFCFTQQMFRLTTTYHNMVALSSERARHAGTLHNTTQHNAFRRRFAQLAPAATRDRSNEREAALAALTRRKQQHRPRAEQNRYCSTVQR